MALSPRIRQLTIVFTTLFAALSTGSSMGYPSILLYQLGREDSEIPLNLDTASWIGSIHGLAGIPGIIAPIVMQWKGRKFTFIAANALLITGWAIAYIANDIATILVSEMLHGLTTNILMTVSYDCLSEMITPIYRNNAIQLYGIIHMIGFAMPGVLTMFVHWRVSCIISCLPAIVAILISSTWLESPLWLAYKDNLDKCKTNFMKLRGNEQFSVKELQEVMAAHTEKLRKSNATKDDTVLKRHWRQITSRDFMIPCLHIFLLMNNMYWSGTIVVLLYSIELLSKSTSSETAAFVGSIIINLILVVGASVGNVLIRFYNNKPIILISSCGATASLLSGSIVTYLQKISILDEKSLVILYILVVYMITTSFGQSSVGFTVSTELMPVKHRGIGGALFVIIQCILHATSLKISPYLFVSIGLYGTFLIYAFNSALCGLLIWMYVPETKGKTLQEIENFYARGTFEIKLLPDEAELIEVKDL